MTNKASSVQTNLLGRRARYARSFGPVQSGPMRKHWDEWGEIAVVRNSSTEGLGFTIRWGDGTLSIELSSNMVEVRHHGERDGGFLDVDMVKDQIEDCSIRTRHGLVVRVCEWDDEESTHVEIFNKGEFPREDEIGSPECYFNIEKGDRFDDGKLAKADAGQAKSESDEGQATVDGFCPKCTSENIEMWEDVLGTRDVFGMNKDGQLEISGNCKTDGEGENSRLHCKTCGHDFKIPESVDVEYV